jgi:hypothetical protein
MNKVNAAVNDFQGSQEKLIVVRDLSVYCSMMKLYTIISIMLQRKWII